MIKINPSKEKNISFNINVQGIDPNVLEYNLRLSNNNVEYGFKGQNSGGEVKFTIPPLTEIANQNNLYNLNEIKLEVHDKNNKYYLKPFQDEVKVEKELKVEAQLSEDEEKDNKQDFSVEAQLSEEKETERKQVIEGNTQKGGKKDPPEKSRPEPPKAQKNTKFQEFLNK